MEAALGLDKPFYVQYFIWLGQVLKGNLGVSIKTYQPVSQMIMERLGPTLLLMGVSLAVSLLISIPAGIYSAVRQYSKGDYAVVNSVLFKLAVIPGFFLSLLLVYIFNIKLKLLPSSGMITLGGSGGIGDLAAHMVMPVTVLAPFHGGNKYPLYPQLHAGDPSKGLSEDSQGKGHRGTAGNRPPRPAERPCAGGDSDRDADSPSVWRRCDRGAAVFLARTWTYDHERYFIQRLSCDYGRLPLSRCGGFGSESGYRYPLCCG